MVQNSRCMETLLMLADVLEMKEAARYCLPFTTPGVTWFDKDHQRPTYFSDVSKTSGKNKIFKPDTL